ncbi:aminoglycoside phosphotransferase family protein [Streptomyces sp. NPDC048664]|uniref:aminoglycoside phosphotransferase family protein n=1 Tax=Streptomyces sp. NPDC048664 TaxID=3154505 RepID=UPI0034215108
MTQAPTPTAETVRRLVRSLLPPGGDKDGEPAVTPVAASGGQATWWVGTRHVLRLALDADASARQHRELRLRGLVRPYTGLAVPKSVARGEWAAGLAYTLDTRLSGSTAERPAVSAIGEADLAALLTGLRGVPVRQAEGLGVPRRAPRSLESVRSAAVAAAALLAERDEFDPARLAQLTLPAARQLTAHAAAALVHHGLGGDHLVMSADGRVRGVLGWADAVLGDPAEDIASLAAALGSPAAVRAATLADYGARPCLRGLWLARCDALVRLAEAFEGRGDGTPPPVLRARLRHAWESIMLERVTELPELPDEEAP